MLTGGEWKSIEDIRHKIGDYPGLCFDYLAVKREKNDHNGDMEMEQYNVDKISETAQNIFKHTKLEANVSADQFQK